MSTSEIAKLPAFADRPRAGEGAADTGEILLHGGPIRLDPYSPPASALLVRGGRAAAAGEVAAVEARAGRGARRIDLRGATVTAGFTDAHVHLTSWALRRGRVALEGAEAIEDAAALVAAATPAPDGWIRGHGWSRVRWDRDPHRTDLDRVVGDTPVFLESHDIHAAWLSSAGLARCGISRDTADPPGGEIVRDAQGNPTGLLLENGRALALGRMPTPAPAVIRSALLDAQEEALRLGLTGVHSVEADGLRDFARLHAAGELRIRVLQAIQLHQLDAAIQLGLRSGFGDEWLRIGGVKMFLDGSLGSRTAWLRRPYVGSDGDRGTNTLPPADFERAVRRAAESGLASTVHAIGDAAVELAARTLAAIEPPASLPHRIEHVQLCPPDLRQLLSDAGIIASMQPAHLLTDIPAAERHWGPERSRDAYPFAALARAGAILAFGSDVPVETLDPRPGLFAACLRATWSAYGRAGAEVESWNPEQSLDGAGALAGYTIGPAVAAGLSHRRGRLHPGFDADLVAWSHDPVMIAPADYPAMEVRLTMVGGRLAFDAISS